MKVYHKNTRVDPQEVARFVTLALVLEPISEKEGCTTRTKDLNEFTRLQYFLASGINVGRYFYQLAERVKRVGQQPKTFYDLALDALKDSNKNISNPKIINFGLLDLLFPLVLSSLLKEGDGRDVCRYVTTVLRESSSEDVGYRDEFRMCGFSTSTKELKRAFTPVGGENLFENHIRWLKASEDAGYQGGVLWAQEFLNGLPMLVAMYETARKYRDAGLLVALEKSFPIGLRRISNLSAGFVADFSAATAYLLLRDSGSRLLIK